MKWKLMERVDNAGDTLKQLAKSLGITYQTLSKKLNEHTEFTRTEIRIIKDRYNLTPKEIDYIFFCG